MQATGKITLYEIQELSGLWYKLYDENGSFVNCAATKEEGIKNFEDAIRISEMPTYKQPFIVKQQVCMFLSDKPPNSVLFATENTDNKSNVKIALPVANEHADDNFAIEAQAHEHLKL